MILRNLKNSTEDLNVDTQTHPSWLSAKCCTVCTGGCADFVELTSQTVNISAAISRL
jgi:hypothetical protein